MKCMEKRNILYKLDKIRAVKYMFSYYLLVSIYTIVSSESGAKPMIKLTSVFYDNRLHYWQVTVD